jgi:hypothetical protein
MSKTIDFGDGYIWTEEEFKYLTIKTKVIVGKLKNKYPDIVTMDFEKDPGNIRIGFQQWGPDSKLILLLGDKDKNSMLVNNVDFETSVPNVNQIYCGNLNHELTQIYEIVDRLIIDYSS